MNGGAEQRQSESEPSLVAPENADIEEELEALMRQANEKAIKQDEMLEDYCLFALD